jgi:hypothetical protein
MIRIKDVSELHRRDREQFQERFRKALDRAVCLRDIAEAETQQRQQGFWAACEELARSKDILKQVADDLSRVGVVGEERTAKLLYLALTTRFFERPVSVILKGPSSGGKSYIVERVLTFFPESTYRALTGMSERALLYDDEPIKHRFLVVFEAAGLSGEYLTYVVRSLLSEGRLSYVTVEKTSEGMRPRTLEREGPTGLILTTTAVKIHAENETRHLSLSVTDTPEQTAAIMKALARENGEGPDFGRWHSLQEWLSTAEHRVTIPYAEMLAEMVPPAAVRLRRDFKAILSLIRASALLHQATRERDPYGRVVASFEDYASVRELVVDLVSEGVEATVPPDVRKVVEETRRLLENPRKESVSLSDLCGPLKLDKSAVSRRVRKAIDMGYLKNLEEKKGKKARLVLDEKMPEDQTILPEVEDLRDRFTVAALCATVSSPPPSDAPREVFEL